ncbi:hypothetical protein ACHAXN_008233 [Cyclotella atomus]
MSLLTKVESILSPITDTFDNKLFLTQLYEPSKIYKAADLLSALSIVGNEPGIADKTFYLGEEGVDLGWEYGLVNLAAFLAQCMKETILYDACDENNWDLVGSQYPLSNSCGQLGQSYQDYNCPAGEKHFQCAVDPEMTITATTHASWYGAPPGLFCGPTSTYPFTGYWDYSHWCDNPWANPPEYCDVYEGQKAGGIDNTEAVANRAGRTDVEGCCWWGRGVIQTTGVCNYGKLNYYLGARAAQDGRSSRYPEIDFCKTPDKICSDPNYPELKWIAGLFYWMESVQSYNQGGWYYLAELHKFVNGGMEDNSFIDAVSGIVNRGCHNPPCATGEVDGATQRRNHFTNVLNALELPSGSNGNRPSSIIPEAPVIVTPNVTQSTYADTDTNETTAQLQLNTYTALTNELMHYQDVIENTVLSYPDLDGVKVKSGTYTFEKLLQSLAYAIDSGYAGEKKFYTNGTMGTSLKYGMVNLAAFLAQAMTESIQYDACEEFHLDSDGAKYAISNSCGQFGNNYQDYQCKDSWDGVLECPIHESMNIKAVDGGKYGFQRPNFYCRSKAEEPFSGVFDERSSSIIEIPYPNSANRTNVEGCCFWGRGALMTKGPCMLGKLNHYLGSRAADEGRAALYPEIDFCARPDLICRESASSNIVWDIALFEWIAKLNTLSLTTPQVERIQSYDKNGWSYIENLHQFVDGGMSDVSFINTVSEIVTGAVGRNVPFTGQRWANFNLLLTNLQLKDEQSFLTMTNFNNFRYRWSSAERLSRPGLILVGFIITGILLLGFDFTEL